MPYLYFALIVAILRDQELGGKPNPINSAW